MKKEITQAIIDTIDPAKILTGRKHIEWDVELGLKWFWWPDHSRRNSLRLTKLGNKVLSKVMAPYTFPCLLENTGANLKRLSKLKTPFYADYQEGTITIYSEQLATMIKMYPSFDRYLEILNGKR